MVVFQEWPRSDFSGALKATSTAGKMDRTLWFYDAKSFNDRLTLKNAPRFWRAPPPFDEAHFASFVQALFVDNGGCFGENDILIVLDGRRSGTSDRASRILGKIIKKARGQFNKRPCGNPLRLFYTNAEPLNCICIVFGGA